MEEVLDILNNLSNKYNISLDLVNITTFTGTNICANVGALKTYEIVNGTKIFKGRDYSKITLAVNESLLKKDSAFICRTITHEFAHILQYSILGKSVIDLNKIKTKVRFTSYQDNETEIQAEAFAIFETGSSNHSKIGCKEMECYKYALDRFMKLINK